MQWGLELGEGRETSMSGIDYPREAGADVHETSFPQRLIGVFTEPGRVLGEVARKPDFIRPLLLLIAVTVVVTETMLSKIGMQRIIRASLVQSGQTARLSPEQINQAVEKTAAIAAVFAHVSGLLAVPIFLALVAAVGLIVLNGFFGVHAGFKKVFAVACYAELPGVIRGVMAVAVIFFGDPNAFDPQSPAPSNPGFFLNPLKTSHAVLALASSLDIFVFWFLILLAMGLSRVSGGKVSSRSIFLVYLGLWMILVLARVGFALFT
ncbi:MAG TPA: YIP1 family protein [Terriglobia bacterium]|nr:YIP1 family protein [Terriglobia bacterium]